MIIDKRKPLPRMHKLEDKVVGELHKLKLLTETVERKR